MCLYAVSDNLGERTNPDPKKTTINRRQTRATRPKAGGTGTLRSWQAPPVGLSTRRGFGGGPQGRGLLPTAGGFAARSPAQIISDRGKEK